jgi:signal transduction histidine kinase
VKLPRLEDEVGQEKIFNLVARATGGGGIGEELG